MERYDAAGWSVSRTAGSHGVADIIALKAGAVPLYVQVKTDRAGPFAHFGPAERSKLLGECTRAGAVAMLVWWPPDRKGPRFLGEATWPK